MPVKSMSHACVGAREINRSMEIIKRPIPIGCELTKQVSLKPAHCLDIEKIMLPFPTTTGAQGETTYEGILRPPDGSVYRRTPTSEQT